MRTIIIILISLSAAIGVPVGVLAQDSLTTLSEAIDLSLKHATSTRIAKVDMEAAEVRSGLLSSDYLPRLNGSMSYSLSQYPQIITPIREQGVFPPLDDQLYEASIRADWQIFDFGESRAIRQKAKMLADAANIKYELANMETIEATASAFIQLQQLKELEQVQEVRIVTLKKSKEQLESLYREGRVAKVDLLKINDAIVEAETAVITTRNYIERILERLSDDLGMDHKLSPDEIAPLDFSNDYQFNPDHNSVETAPTVRMARQHKQASDYEVKASYRAFLPQFNLFAAEQFRTGSDFEVDDQWVVGLRLNIPLFENKVMVNNQVKIKEAKSQDIRLEQTRQQYRQQLNGLINAQFETQKRIQSTETRIIYLEETYRVENSAYREGRTTLTDLLATESKLNSVRAELIAMRAQNRLLNLNIAVLTGQLNKELAIKMAEGEQL